MILDLAGVCDGLLIWRGAAMIIRNPGVVPSPGSVFAAMADIAFSSEASRLGVTLLRAFGGWLLAAVLAIPLGVLLGAHAVAYRLAAPWLSPGRCLHVFALAGSAIGLLPGSPEAQRFVVIWLTVFLIALQIVSAAAAIAPRRRMDFARVLAASRAFLIWQVLAWECSGGIASAPEVTLPTAVIVTLVVETTLLPTKSVGLC